MKNSPGKFENCPPIAEVFWAYGLDGLADEDDGETYIFRLTPADWVKHPETYGKTKIEMSEDPNGFVYFDMI